jgi:hypothetical protein
MEEARYRSQYKSYLDSNSCLCAGFVTRVTSVWRFIFDNTTTLEWFQAIVYAIQCMGLQTNRAYAAPGIMGVLLTIVASLLGLVFTAVWVTIFMGAFDIIFKKPQPKDGKKEVGGEI